MSMTTFKKEFLLVKVRPGKNNEGKPHILLSTAANYLLVEMSRVVQGHRRTSFHNQTSNVHTNQALHSGGAGSRTQHHEKIPTSLKATGLSPYYVSSTNCSRTTILSDRC